MGGARRSYATRLRAPYLRRSRPPDESRHAAVIASSWEIEGLCPDPARLPINVLRELRLQIGRCVWVTGKKSVSSTSLRRLCTHSFPRACLCKYKAKRALRNSPQERVEVCSNGEVAVSVPVICHSQTTRDVSYKTSQKSCRRV